MTIWWPDSALEYVGLVVYVVLAAIVVRWLAGVDTNAIFVRLFREEPNSRIAEYVDCEEPSRCPRELCATCASGRDAYTENGGDAERWPSLMEETRGRWRRHAKAAREVNDEKVVA